jgi:dTDP-4-amino-4,6-dideoxygalactose transaminase
MTEIQAAIGLVQLSKLERFTEQRIENARFLTARLREAVQTPLSRSGHRHVYHQYTIRVPGNRDEWMTKLRARGIATGVHYPIPIYQQPFYRDSVSRFRISCPVANANKENENSDALLPVTEAAAEQVLSLPVHPALSEGDLSTISREVLILCE